jgi:hypothetical protein
MRVIGIEKDENVAAIAKQRMAVLYENIRNEFIFCNTGKYAIRRANRYRTFGKFADCIAVRRGWNCIVKYL